MATTANRHLQSALDPPDLLVYLLSLIAPHLRAGDGSHEYAVRGVTADSAEPGYGYSHSVLESPAWFFCEQQLRIDRRVSCLIGLRQAPLVLHAVSSQGTQCGGSSWESPLLLCAIMTYAWGDSS